MLTSIKVWLTEHAPSFFSPSVLDQLAEVPGKSDSPSDAHVPPAPWLYASKDTASETGRSLPQTIAHRGYRALYPENTLLALRAAVEQSHASALETDLRLTKDEVIVLSHDDSLKRVFGKENGNMKITESTYDSLSHLRTVREPREPLARLDELLSYLASPSTRPDIWVMLDIKLHQDMRLFMSHISKTIASIPPHPQRPWNQRLVLGVWAETCVPLCTELLPGFPVAHIGVSTDYAARFLSPHPTTSSSSLEKKKTYENISFNLLTESILLKPETITNIKRANRPIIAWNALQENWLEWCIDAELDGVITDDPKRFDKMKADWIIRHNNTAASGNSNEKGTKKKFGRKPHDILIWLIMTIFNTFLSWRAENMGLRIDGTRISSF